MRITRVALLLTLAGVSLSCENSLDQIVESRHQAKLDAANANRPLMGGANDGLGVTIADTAHDGIKLSEHDAAKSP